MDNIYDTIIVGSGPSGLTAGIYTSRGNRKTLILAGRKWGGQLMLTTEVENFPGFPEPIMGPELMKKMRDQAVKYGAEILDVNFVSGDYSKRPFKVTTDDEKDYYSKSIIIATGADTKWLQIPGEEEKIGRGVSSCAPCDAAFYRNKRVVVVGGGDSAMEEALVLTKFASEVYIIHRRDSFKASDVMQKKVFDNEKIKVIWNTEPIEIKGEMKVEKIILKTQNQDKVDIASLGGTVTPDSNGEVSWEFPTDGVFVSGDVHDSRYMQGVTAAGYGCQAALDVEHYLEMS